MSDTVFNILFICRENAARSIMAESVMNHVGASRFRAFSAGSEPRGAVHPMALRVLRELRYEVDHLRSKSWNEFLGPDAPQMDFIVALCEPRARDQCPVWNGRISAYWGFDDPALVTDSEEAQHRAFQHAEIEIVERIRLIMNLPVAQLARKSLRHADGQVYAPA